MSAHCCEVPPPPNDPRDSRYGRVLWIALTVNLIMFAVEVVSGVHAGSASLLADAVDFFSDAANYALSLAVLSMLPVWRARAALLKGLAMGAFGLFVLGKAAWNAKTGVVPEAFTMGVVGFVALAANLGVAALLYRYRTGDANRRAVWLCTRNDAVGNVAVMLAALGVFGTASGWPDFAVAAIMGSLALMSAVTITRLSLRELEPRPHPHAH